MKPNTAASPPLLPEWAFVVQFRVGTDLDHGQGGGRVEHVVSGQATRFQSPQELLAFMAQVLASLRVQSRQRARGGERYVRMRRRH
jgi:hypothetical protein